MEPGLTASAAGIAGRPAQVIANQASYGFSGVLGASIAVALLALAVEGAFALLQRAVTPRGLRVSPGRDIPTVGPPAADIG